MKERLSFKQLFNVVLNGMALGIVSGLIANAVLGTLFKYLGKIFLPDVFNILTQSVVLLQFSVPVLIGVAVGKSMNFDALETTVLGAAILAGSGSIVYNSQQKVYTTVPMGDLFNVLLVAIISTLIIKSFSGKFGSLTIIFLPIIGGAIPSSIGLITLPYMKKITKFLADIVLTFTNLQPILMCILIAMSFSLFIVTPVSTVAMGIILFSNSNHIGAGAAALGVVSAAAVLMIGSMKANNPKGVSYAILLGAIKLMMPNCARQPLLLVPIMLTAGITGLAGYFFNILGDHTSAGFGVIGLVGPVKSFEMANSGIVTWLPILTSYILIPFVVGFIINKICVDILKIYKKEAFSTQSLN